MRLSSWQRIGIRTSVPAVGVLLFCTVAGKADESYGAPPPNLTTHLDRLVRSYPDWVSGSDEKYLILRRGGQRCDFGRQDKQIFRRTVGEAGHR
jgi:hypothetical protein